MSETDEVRAQEGVPDERSSATPAPPISGLVIVNLKAFEGAHTVPLAPLTLIYGPNSAGKSTVLQSLVLLREYVVGPPGWEEVNRSKWEPWSNSTQVDGLYWPQIGPLLSRHDFSLAVEVGLEFSTWTAGETYRAVLRLWMEERPKAELRFERNGEAPRDVTPEVVDTVVFSPEFGRLKELLTRAIFLEPHREGRNGLYPYRDQEPEVFLNRASREESERRHTERDNAVNEWLERLDVPYQVLPLTALGMTAEEARAFNRTDMTKDAFDEPLPTATGMRYLRDVRSGVTVTVDQVGYGVSQLLPIVDVCMSDSDQVICIEQPELHLHPRLQSDLGELLVESVLRGNQVIAETHSENILLRVQRMVRQNRLRPEDVAVLYVDNNHEDGVSIERLTLGEDGDLLEPWPTGFFDDRLDDILGILE